MPAAHAPAGGAAAPLPAAVPHESRTLTKEDRVKLVRLVLEEGYTVAEAARSIVRTLNASGPVSENTVRLWLERFRHTGASTLDACPPWATPSCGSSTCW